MKSAIGIPIGHWLAGFFWLGIAVLVFFGLRSLSPAEPGGLGPATFPKILAASLVALVVMYWSQSRRAQQVSFLSDEAPGSRIKACALSLLAFASALLWERIGALPILVALGMIELRWIENFSWLRVLGVGLSLSIGMWVVFTQLLGVNLPVGILIWFY